MPLFKITQQQGHRFITSNLEADSAESVRAFLEATSTAKIKYIYRVEYEDEISAPPPDNFQYFKQFKAILKSNDGYSKQLLLYNVKKTRSEAELTELCKTYLKVSNRRVDSIICVLFME